MIDPSSPASPVRAGSCPLPQESRDCIALSHGGGGRLSRDLVEDVFLPAFGNPTLDRLGDAAVLPAPSGRLAFTTDAFVVQPLFFPGGSIGELAVHGTINDLAMCGARPRWLSAAFVLEEGLPLATLRQIVDRMAAAARDAGVPIVAGDTKVVERGRGDGCYITTAGIGEVDPQLSIGPERAQPGDAVIVSGPLGNHGMAVMSVRQGLAFESTLQSDTAPLHGLVAAMLEACREVRVLRDATRGGAAAVLNEIAQASRCSIWVDEQALPVDAHVRAACEMLGLDPLLVANEGKLVAIVPPADADQVLHAMHRHPLGGGAVRVGDVAAGRAGKVLLRTPYGTHRILPIPLGEQLPRIC